MTAKQVAVIGAGTIGASWAACFLARGLSVVASDPAPDAEAFIRNYINTAWPTLVRLGLAPGASMARFRFQRDPVNAVNAADFVQESAPERMEVKVELLERLDRVLPPEVILASSSSGLLISDIAERCRHPERCIIGHPFSPPHMIPLVEVVGGRHTSPAIVERALAFYREIGKRPIHVRKEMRGLLVNRLQAALGDHGSAPHISPRGRRRRHGPFYAAPRRAPGPRLVAAAWQSGAHSRHPEADC
jgi:carnitine 3-dehydrogenase